jgi:hypothetical protein
MPPIPERAGRAHTQCMTELFVAYERPASLTESEFHSWLVGCAKALANTSASLTLAPGTQGDLDMVRLTVEGDPQSTSAQDAIGELLGDMRMLGLRPAVIAAEDGETSDVHNSTPEPSPDP